MLRSIQQLVSAFFVVAALGGCGRAAGAPVVALPAPASIPEAQHSRIVIVTMENEESDAVLGDKRAPFINRFARRGGVATRSYAIRHPSLPNYLALTSGSTHGITSDCTH